MLAWERSMGKKKSNQAEYSLALKEEDRGKEWREESSNVRRGNNVSFGA